MQAVSTQMAILHKLHTIVNTLKGLGYTQPQILPWQSTPNAMLLSQFILAKKKEQVGNKYIKSCVYQWDQLIQ